MTDAAPRHHPGAPAGPIETGGGNVPGLPAAAVDGWLRQAAPDVFTDEAWQAEVLSGGLSNITYRLHGTGGTVILRRPPLGGVLASAHDMGREFRVMSALAGSAVPVPTMIAHCPDDRLIGAPFFLMADVPGVVLRTPADAAALSRAERADLGGDLVRVLAELHALDPAAVGLADFGRPAGYLARQLRRWAGQWEKSRTRPLPEMEELIARLAVLVPLVPQGRSVIVHGDYRLDNTIVTGPADATPARIAAVVDWELSTLGDAIADLATTMTYTELAQDEVGPVGGAAHADGFPKAAEIADRYAVLTGADLTELAVHRAVATMKLGIILEGVHARYAAGHTVSQGYEGVAAIVPVLAARGLQLLDRPDG